ncbi:MAG TPA: hypothetical protein VHX88_14925 [Solirubrobacteraceae bacterium]|jgi:hypothetical protein|nr:hypothetical protein [Solirubrobacteraceae bacterium]
MARLRPHLRAVLASAALAAGGVWAAAPASAASTSPSAVINAAGTHEYVFYSGAGGSLSLFYWNGKTWTDNDLGGEPVQAGTSPSAAINSAGEPSAFYAGEDGSIWEEYFDGAWHNQDLGGSVAAGTSPSAQIQGADQFVWYVGPGNVMYELYSGGSSWSNQDRGGETVAAGSSPSAQVVGKDEYVFYVGANAGIYEDYFDGTWHNLLPRTGTAAAPGTSPSAAIDSSGGQYVEYVGTGHTIWELGYAGGWANVHVGGSLAPGTSPSAEIDPSTGSLYIWYVSANGTIGEYYWNAKTKALSNPQVPSVVAAADGSPTSAIVSGGGDEFVWYAGSNDAIWEDFWNGSAWSEQSRGGSVGAPAPAPPPAPAPTPVQTTPVPTQTPTSKAPHRVHAKLIISWTWNGRHTRIARIRVKGLPHDGILSLHCHGHGCPVGALSAGHRRLGGMLHALGAGAYRAGDELTFVLSAPRLRPEVVQVVIRDARLPTARLL